MNSRLEKVRKLRLDVSEKARVAARRWAFWVLLVIFVAAGGFLALKGMLLRNSVSATVEASTASAYAAPATSTSALPTETSGQNRFTAAGYVEPIPPLLAAKPSDYTGKIVAVSGVVERVSEAKKMFTLVDPSEAGCVDGCFRAMIVAQLGQGVTTLPKVMEPVIAIGEVDASAPAVRVTVTELVSGKEAIDARLKQLSAKQEM
jgi:hypothetical protein